MEKLKKQLSEGELRYQRLLKDFDARREKSKPETDFQAENNVLIREKVVPLCGVFDVFVVAVYLYLADILAVVNLVFSIVINCLFNVADILSSFMFVRCEGTIELRFGCQLLTIHWCKVCIFCRS